MCLSKAPCSSGKICLIFFWRWMIWMFFTPLIEWKQLVKKSLIFALSCLGLRIYRYKVLGLVITKVLQPQSSVSSVKITPVKRSQMFTNIRVAIALSIPIHIDLSNTDISKHQTILSEYTHIRVFLKKG